MNWRGVCANLCTGKTGWEKYVHTQPLFHAFFCVLYRPLPNALLELRFLIDSSTDYFWSIVVNDQQNATESVDLINTWPTELTL
jgi:hypothetical protein